MDNNQNDNRRNGGDQGPNRSGRNNNTFVIFLAVTLVTLLVMALVNSSFSSSTSSVEITYDKFLELLDEGQVSEVTIYSDEIEITLKSDTLSEYLGTSSGTVTYYTGNPGDPNLVARLDQAGVSFTQNIPDTTSSYIWSLILSFAPLIIIWVIFAFAMRRMTGGSGGMMGVGKSKAKV